GGDRFHVSHPLYSDQPITGTAIEVNRAAGQEIHFGDLRLNALAGVLGAPGSGPLPGLAEWIAHLEELEAAGTPLADDPRRRLAENRAAAWGALRQAFTESAAASSSADTYRDGMEERFRTVAGLLGQLPVPVRTNRFTRTTGARAAR